MSYIYMSWVKIVFASEDKELQLQFHLKKAINHISCERRAIFLRANYQNQNSKNAETF